MTLKQGWGADRQLSSLKSGDSLDKIIDTINEITQSSLVFSRKLSLASSFDGYLVEDVKIPANSSILIQHFLGVKPKWRIILRQVGNGVITDIPSSWTDKVIALYNNGAVEVTASIFIVRE